MVQNIVIRGTGIYLPKNEVSNEYFEEYFRRLGVEVKGLMTHLNRRKRFLADRDESSLSMGYAAAVNALEKLNMDAKELDMIVFATDTPEYNMPTNALKLNHTGYNKKELSKELRTSSQKLTHTKDTLYTLASITGDERYLTAREAYKEGAAVCEVAETLFQMGVEESRKELEQKEAVLARTKSDLAKAQSTITEKENAITEKENAIAEKDSEIELLRAEIERLKQTQASL